MAIDIHSQSFPKAEHLCSRKLIERLYTEGQRMRVFPYSILWLEVEEEIEVPCQVIIVAPKRIFKHAVDRNRIRRLTRECYRRRKSSLLQSLQEQNKHILLSLVYIHNEELSYSQLGQRMDKAIAHIKEATLPSL